MAMTASKTSMESPVDLALYNYIVPDTQWQTLWFALVRKPWSSLVVVPSHPSGSGGGSALAIATALADVGKLQRLRPVHLVNAEGVELTGTGQFIQAVETLRARNEMAIIAIDALHDNQAAIPIARAADAALLVVQVGAAEVKTARRTIQWIGKDRFIGSVAAEARARS